MKLTEKRRLIKNGYSHYIALPKIWLRSQGLGGGERLILELEENGDITIKRYYGVTA